MNKPGRPTSFTPELAAEICGRLANGESLRSVCRVEGMPSTSMVMRWLSQDSLFREQYAQSKAEGLEVMADEILEIADEPVGYLDNGATDSGAVNKQRLQVDTRKWLLSKLAPKKYGDSSKVELSGSLALNTMSDDEIRAELAALTATGVLHDPDASDLV